MDNFQIDFDEISVIEEFDKQCGEVFLSIEGDLSFLCTLCGLKYQGYQAYADHIFQIHHPPNANNDDESIHTDNQIQIESLNDETEAVIVSDLDVASPGLNDGFELIDDVEFDAPIPDNCVEIEEYSAAIRSMKDTMFSQNISSSIEGNNKNLKPPITETVKTAVKSTNIKSANNKVRRYRCPKCDFVTKSYSTVMMHIARHMGQKRHFCPQCNKGFYTSTELRVHTRSHTGERPYLCTECGQRFVTNSALWRHTKSCKDIRDKECPECDMKFHDSVALRNHMAVHSDHRSFRCTECDATFKLSKALRNHIKIHENKHEFKCRYCPASFNQQPGLFSHVRNKHSKAAPAKNK